MDSDNTIKRRDFLGTSSAAAIVGAASLNGVAGDLLAGDNTYGRLECSHFENLVGDTFTVSDQRVAMKLVDAQATNPRDARPAHVRAEPFSLLFTAPEGTELNDSIHRVSHGGLGSFDLLVQRVRTDSHRGDTFEITFS